MDVEKLQVERDAPMSNPKIIAVWHNTAGLLGGVTTEAYCSSNRFLLIEAGFES